MKRTRVGAPALALLVLVASVVGATAAAAAKRPVDRDAPTLSLSPAIAAPGTTILVSGTGWPAGSLISLEVCGRDGDGGSANCDLPASTITGSDAEGRFGSRLLVNLPPAPCPCVVKVAAVGADLTRTIAVTIIGAPLEQATTKPHTGPPLRIEGARLTGGSWPGWFGLAIHRTLVVKVHNVSGASLEDPVLQVTVGRDSAPGTPQSVPLLGRLDADETRTVRVPVELGAASIGNYTVRASAGSAGVTSTKGVGTSTYPWGLLVVALVLLQLVLLAFRNRARRRLAAKEAAAGAEADAGDAATSPPVSSNGSSDTQELPALAWKASDAVDDPQPTG
jgi:hypothetical protein